MNIESLYMIGGLDSIITEMEVALQIDGKDYELPEFIDVLAAVQKRINRQYLLDFSVNKITDIVFETKMYRDSASLFIDNISMIHAKLCAFCQIERYTVHTDVLLSNINYMSFKADSLMMILKELQMKRTMAGVAESVKVIEGRMQTVRISREKRLFMLMLISYELGLYEVVSTIAEILYFGGIL